MNPLHFVTQAHLDDLSSQAKQSPRLRQNCNFHPSDEALCHRLLNAMEPDSYIQPHRHGDVNKSEALVALRGEVGVIIFDAQGRITQKAIMMPNGPMTMVDIPHGMFHTLLSLQSGTVFFEAKAGPYKPLTREEKAPWAPEEGSKEAHAYLLLMRQALERGRA